MDQATLERPHTRAQGLLDGATVVVDVQPAYDRWCAHLTPRLMAELNACTGPIAAVFVGEGITSDSREDVIAYWAEHGASDELLERVRFIEKGYGFFRGWMDMGLDDCLTVEVASYMRKNGIRTTDDIDEELLRNIVPDADEFDVRRMMASTIYLPGELEGLTALNGRDWTTCGGGHNECLREFELWMDSMGIVALREDNLVY